MGQNTQGNDSAAHETAMKWIAAKVTFTCTDQESAADLVASVFFALGLNGVVIDDAIRNPQLDWCEDAADPPPHPGVTGYFADTPDLRDTLMALEAALRRLERNAGITTRVTYDRLDEQDWAKAWKRYFWPQKITDTIVVKPSWREYRAKPGEVVLEIDPGMAFGTGTHPTTVLCLRLLEAHLFPGSTFLDVGTGSGILMIAAAKLNAESVYGVDNDEVAVSVAEKNLRANRIADNRFTLSTGNLVDDQNRAFDVVAANILAEVILVLLPKVCDVLKTNGVFICSGIISAKKDGVLSSLQQHHFTVLELLEKEDWVAIAARKTEVK
jgi:ribosomal protein L11 methyltransferase